MILNLKRYISLLLVLMLLIGIVPTVNAAELDSESTLHAAGGNSIRGIGAD